MPEATAFPPIQLESVEQFSITTTFVVVPYRRRERINKIIETSGKTYSSRCAEKRGSSIFSYGNPAGFLCLYLTLLNTVCDEMQETIFTHISLQRMMYYIPYLFSKDRS